MPNAGELQRKIRLILSQVDFSAPIYRLTEREYLAKRLQRRAKSELPGDPDADEPILDEVVNEQVLLLKTLCSQSQTELQGEFFEILFDQLTGTTAGVIVHSVLELGRLDLLREALLKEQNMITRYVAWNAIHEKLRREPHRFTDADLNLIEALRGQEVARTPRRPPEADVTF